MKNSFYFMLEGGDGGGKDTQTELLVPFFEERGYRVILTREIGGTPGAVEAGKIVKNKEYKFDSLTEVFLFLAGRRDLSEKVIRQELERENTIVLSNRGFPSTHAYQGFAGGVNISLIKRLNEITTGGLLPDRIYIIDVDPTIGLKKEVNPDGFAAKGLDYHNQVRRGYLDFVRHYPDICKVIDYRENCSGEMQEEIRNDLLKNFTLSDKK